MSVIITNVALDVFSPEELAQVRLAACSLREPGATGIVILPARPELYKLTRTSDGVTLDLCVDVEAARLLAGG